MKTRFSAFSFAKYMIENTKITKSNIKIQNFTISQSYKASIGNFNHQLHTNFTKKQCVTILKRTFCMSFRHNFTLQC